MLTLLKTPYIKGTLNIGSKIGKFKSGFQEFVKRNKVLFISENDSFSMKLTDNGQGIDPEIIKDKIIEKRLKTEEEIHGKALSLSMNFLWLVAVHCTIFSIQPMRIASATA